MPASEAISKSPSTPRVLLIITRPKSLYAVVKALGAPDMRKKMQEQGMVPQPTTQEEFARYLQQNVVKYTKVVKESGIQVDF